MFKIVIGEKERGTGGVREPGLLSQHYIVTVNYSKSPGTFFSSDLSLKKRKRSHTFHQKTTVYTGSLFLESSGYATPFIPVLSSWMLDTFLQDTHITPRCNAPACRDFVH